MAETQKEKIMRLLNCSAEEAESVIAYDKAVDKAGAKTRLEFDLTEEQAREAKKYAKAGTKKAPTVYKFDKKGSTHKENPAKEGIISALYGFLSENSDFSLEKCEISNPARQISFTLDGISYDLTLVQHRKPK